MNQATHTIRDCTRLDHPQVLRLNLESEHFLSPLTLTQLESLHTQSWYCRVIAQQECVLGFLLVLREGARYDSVNYLWFAARYSQFLYIDRVAVDANSRGQHLAQRLYEDLFAHARASHFQRITCEYDTEPPNEASRRFHQRLGFREVGSQRTASGKKTVSLQELLLT
jgi:uncharacterized protein